MRSPNHIEIKKGCKESIPGLMKKHKLGLVNSIEVDTEGWVNPCFFVNDEFVFRFNARDPKLPKFQREKIIFDRLLETEVPVPKKVILDESKEISQYDVLISGLLPGKNIEADWKNLTKSDQIQISSRAGEQLKKLHSINFDFFGEISSIGPLPQTKTWAEYLKTKLDYHLNEAAPISLFSRENIESVLLLFKKHLPYLEEVKEAKLVHVDFHLGNMLHLNNKINAVLDFEWAMAGDPIYDMSRWLAPEDVDEVCTGSHEPFLKAYGYISLSESEKRRVAIYQIIKNIEMCVVAKLYFSEEESKEYLKITVKHINSLL